MMRTVVRWPDDVAMLLEREARRLDTTVPELGRRAVAASLDSTAGGPVTLPFANLGSSGHRYTGRDLEAILADEWSVRTIVSADPPNRNLPQ